MTVKLVLLKSNEEVIADVKELVDADDKPIFVVLENAYCCKLVEAPVMFTEGKEETETQYSVQYYPWMPLSDEKKISIDPSWVVAIVEPKPMVKQSYEARLMEQEVKILVLVNGDILISGIEEVAAVDIGDPNCKMISPYN